MCVSVVLIIHVYTYVAIQSFTHTHSLLLILSYSLIPLYPLCDVLIHILCYSFCHALIPQLPFIPHTHLFCSTKALPLILPYFHTCIPQFRLWLFSLGNTLCLAVMISKLWRVYYIFRAPSPKRKVGVALLLKRNSC